MAVGLTAFVLQPPLRSTVAPAAVELGWFLAINSRRLPCSLDEVMARYAAAARIAPEHRARHDRIVGDVADTYEEELIVRDLDLDLIKEVRDTWAFYRDRRPDAYGPLVQP